MKWPLSAKPGSTPGACCAGLKAARATSSMPSWRSVPAIVKTPSANSTSASAASKRCAAMRRPLAISLSAAWTSAAPPTGIEREPPVPRPKAIGSGVALQHADLVEGDAEPLGGELGVGGLMPLPGGLRPHQDRQSAARVEAQFGEFVGRKARLLDIDGVAEPAIAAARPRRGAPRRKPGEIGGGERLVHVAGKLAAVVVEAERCRDTASPRA